MLESMQTSFMAAAPFCIVGGLLIAIVGRIILQLSHVVENRCTIPKKGYILENKQEKRKNTTLYYPMVAYEIDNINYTILYRLGTKLSKYHAGQSVDIKVNPGDHSEIFIETDKSRSYERLAELIMAAGLIIFTTSIITYLLLRKI